MHIFSALIYAFCANVDCLPLSISYGMNKTKIDFKSNLIISTLSSLGTFVAMQIGIEMQRLMKNTSANSIGAILLILLGMYFLYDYFNSKDKNDPTYSIITLKEILFLSFTLTINNVSLGISAGITGTPVISATIFSFINCIIFIIVGQRIADSFLVNIFKKYSACISAILLIMLGIYELLI